MGRPRRSEALRTVTDSPTVRLPKALKSLVKARAVMADPLKDFVRRVPGGLKAIHALLQFCSDDPDAKRLSEAWDVVLERTSVLAKFHITDVIEYADMSPREFVGVVSRCAWEMNMEAAKGLFAMNYPRIMDASIQRSVENDATDERAIHFKASGHLPQPQGMRIAIQQNNADRDPNPGEAPPVAHTARRIVRDLPE